MIRDDLLNQPLMLCIGEIVNINSIQVVACDVTSKRKLLKYDVVSDSLKVDGLWDSNATAWQDWKQPLPPPPYLASVCVSSSQYSRQIMMRFRGWSSSRSLTLAGKHNLVYLPGRRNRLYKQYSGHS